MDKNVKKLIEIGPLFSEQDENLDENTVQKFQTLLKNITQPVSIEAAKQLILQFSFDSSFGLAWMLIEHIESANWKLQDYILHLQKLEDSTDNKGEWISVLKVRAQNKLRRTGM